MGRHGTGLAVMQGLLLLCVVMLFAGIAYAIAEPAAAPPAHMPARATAMPAEIPAARAAVLDEPVLDEALTPSMFAALEYAARRYRVSATALLPIFATAEHAATDLGLDPLLIIAVIGIESGFNPFSESAKGAQGLMQVIPRFHKDKLPEDAGKLHLFDPVANVRIGALALHEYIRSHGDVAGGLQQFAGDPNDPAQGYAVKVLAEKERLQLAARRYRAGGA